jgi:DNA mismatch repair ATPase MutS
MKYLRTIGARGVFATHMHELAEDLDEINKQPALSNLVSLVAGVDETKQMEVMTEEGVKKFRGSKRTYKIIESPPQGRSFALDIARTYGITFEQLLESHKNRYELGVEEETPLPRRIV